MYHYIQSEPRLWTVGYQGDDGKFMPCADHDSAQEAEDHVIRLNGGTPAPKPSAGTRDLSWWIENHEAQCRVYMEGLNAIQQDMETRDTTMRYEVRWEMQLKTLEAGIVLAAMGGDDPIFDECKNDRQRDAALINWKATEPEYIAALHSLNEVKRERSILEANIRAKELACSLIKRDIDFSTAVVNAMGRGL